MGRASTKNNKNIYQIARENNNLTLQDAEDCLNGISKERLHRIEYETTQPRPDEILEMADKYKEPAICNYYCSHDCEIGKKYVPEIKTNDLSEIVLKMLASLNSTQDRQKRLIEITADGKIEKDEIKDFIAIQKDLEQISQTVEALQLWVEKKLHDGGIDFDEYVKQLDNKWFKCFEIMRFKAFCFCKIGVFILQILLFIVVIKFDKI